MSALARSITRVAIPLLFLSCASAYAGVITFEDLPDAFFFNGGGQNIGNFYPGVTFGPNVTGLGVSRFGGYASDAFPPHSGDVVVWDAADPNITVAFSSPIPHVGIWYTSFDPLTLQAFDASNNVLGTVIGDPNTDGTTGTSSYLSISNPGISYVSVASSPGLFTLDDVTTAPEPSTFGLLAASFLAMCLCRCFGSGASGLAPCFGSRRCGPAGATKFPGDARSQASARGYPGRLAGILGRLLLPPPGSRFLLVALVLLCLPGLALSQSSLTIGAPADGKLTSPFSWCCTYQQVFSSSDFPGSVCHGDVCVGVPGYTISSIAFTGAQGITSGNGVLYDAVYTITLSTTTTPVNGLNTSDLSKNIGFNSQTFYSAHLVGSIPNGQALTFTGNPYTYYPQAGNLLVTITQTSADLSKCIATPQGGYWLCPPGISLDARSGTANGLFSSAYPNEAAGVGNNRGSVVTFGVTPTVPPCTAPSITTQPSSQSITTGSSATLSVAAGGTSLQYQWYANNTLISGANASSYSTGPLASTTTYNVVVTNACGSVTSATATVTVAPCSPAAILTQPTDTTVTSGNSATLGVAATGTALQYQWYQGTSLIPGATSSTFTTGPLANTSQFYVVVTGQCGAPVTSRTVTVTATPACTPPTIVVPPASQSVVTGTSATLAVIANGSTLQYQWYQSGGTLIPGATTSAYTTPPLGSPSYYYVTIRNSCGSAQSPIVVVEIDVPLGPPSSFNPTGTTKEPVNTATGSYYTSHADLKVQGRGVAFSLVRFYNSNDAYSGPLGVGWTHSYNLFLTVDGQTGVVAIKQGDGSRIYFAPAGTTTYSAVTVGLSDRLAKNPDGTFTLTRKNQLRLVFSPDGKLMKTVDRNGNTQSLTYNSAGYLTVVADSSGRSFAFTNDANGHLLTVSDPIGRLIRYSYSYDASGNLATFQDALGGTTQYSYDSGHRLVSATDSRGVVYVENTYDAQGRVVLQKNGRGLSTTLAYNTPGANMTSITDALGNTTKHVYDSNLRLVQNVNPNGGTTTFGYDANNNKASIINPNGRTTTSTYDAYGNVTSITNPLGQTALFSYDVFNNNLTATDPTGKVTQFTYDAAGNRISITDPLGNTMAFTYDATGNVLSRTNALGHKTTMTYDGNGNVTSVKNSAGNTSTFTYDAVSRLVFAADGNGHGRALNYDALDRKVKTRDPLGNDGAGNKVAVNLGNGVRTAYAYDDANRLVSAVNASGVQVLNSYAYTLDKVGNRVQVRDAAGGLTRYGYDALNRLVSWTTPSGQVTTYGYDAVGNRTSQTSSAGTVSYTYDAADRLLVGGASSYTYDGNGNRLTKTTGSATLAYSFDSLNRLTAVSGGGVAAQYQYDGDGSRVGQQVGSSTYRYALDVVRSNASVLIENGPDGNTNYQYGLSKLSGSSTTFEYFYQVDGVGSTVAVTDTTGSLKASYAYDPWGRLLNPVDPLGTRQKVKFTGEALDPQTGLYFLGTRYYDPLVGRFISKDPLPGLAPLPQTTNGYAYALSNPVNQIDPSGLAAEPVSSGQTLSTGVPRALQSWTSLFLPWLGSVQPHVINPAISR